MILGCSMATMVTVRRLDALAERAVEILEEGKNREYGAYVVGEFEGRIGLRRRVIYEVIDRYSRFPIVPPGAQLSWSDYRRLLGVGNLIASTTRHGRRSVRGRRIWDRVMKGWITEEHKIPPKTGRRPPPHPEEKPVARRSKTKHHRRDAE